MYRKYITRENPSCLIFLIDQSGSMSDPFGAQVGRSKAEGLADAINRLLQVLTISCTKNIAEGIRNYYQVAVIGYHSEVGSVWDGALSGRVLVPIREVGDNPARIEERQRKIEDGVGGLVTETIKFPVWFYPAAKGETKMCQALFVARELLEPWVKDHRSSFPPLVINLTDGEATDGDPLAPAQRLRELGTDDGPVLLFNLHISAHAGNAILYPHSEIGLPDQFAVQLFRMSSCLPEHVRSAASAKGYSVSTESRGFGFNADLAGVISFLNIGTESDLR